MSKIITEKEEEKLISDIRTIIDERYQLLLDDMRRQWDRMLETGNTGIRVFYTPKTLTVQLEIPLDGLSE
jgi:hypothetical protein